MTRTAHARRRRGLQWTLAFLAAAPMISGAREVLWGARGVPGGSPDISSTVDGELRYANVFKIAVGPVILSQLSLVERSPIVDVALGTVFLGGLARLLSWQQRGRPHPSSLVALGLETAVAPALIAWRRSLSVQEA
ncbi:DUF4345 domain-containing protein [Rhodococcus sp. WB9]|uniref:DUF4345 domain-containing protein n=1 Tax=Rhodococcus sp. WB9 TaxID=2594007 RepID=UPI001184AA3E|nr:DUF4345 domain-containing protein [Rhodococcus sp. WB9]QDQ95407.1 DUF4345 domain-containing protein [Rhodococcus sp. WB9]